MCNHETVTNNGEGWACMKCGEAFAPIAMLQHENDNVLDTVTAVFAATLWDLHERAFEAHGIPHAQSDATSEAVCEEKGHDMDENGTCLRCGKSPFLGA